MEEGEGGLAVELGGTAARSECPVAFVVHAAVVDVAVDVVAVNVVNVVDVTVDAVALHFDLIDVSVIIHSNINIIIIVVVDI